MVSIMANPLRESARGKECLVRIPCVCNGNSDTVVLAHLNGAGVANKMNDLHGAFCCSSCHDQLDGRVKSLFSKDELKLMHLEGIKRTQDYWLSTGHVTIQKPKNY